MILTPDKIALRPPEDAQDNPAKSIAAEGIEYAIYIHHPANDDRRTPPWERAAITKCRNTALSQAEKLYGSRKYEKVEIKRTVFDHNRGLRRGDTVLVIGSTARKRLRNRAATAALYLALTLLAAALSLTLISAVT